MARCGWFLPPLLLSYVLELYRLMHIIYTLCIYIYIYIYIWITFVGLIGSSDTNIHLSCCLQQTSHVCKSITQGPCPT